MDQRYTGVAPAGGGFNRYAAGAKTYGGGRSMPNLGPVQNMAGYNQRDLVRARQNFVLKRMQQNTRSKFEVM